LNNNKNLTLWKVPNQSWIPIVNKKGILINL